MDRTQRCGRCNAGSTPTEGTMSLKFLIIALLILTGTVAGVLFYINISYAPQIINFSSIPETKKPSTTSVNIVSVGDIFLHENNMDAAYNAETKTYNFDSVFLPVANYFKNADLSTAWLGAVYDPKGPYMGYPLFKSPPALIDTLQNIGLDVVFRTNHTMDFGTKGLNMTTQILQDHNIAQIAAASTEEDSKKIFIYQKDNLKIAYLGYIYGMNGLPIPEPWMINLIDLNKIKSDITEAKKQTDFVVVALHFGEEYERLPNQSQKNIAQAVANSGADLIVASHVHVIQTVETVTTDDGRTVYVAYGLGNFYCGQRARYMDAGLMLNYTIEKTNEKTSLKNISYTPTWVAGFKENSKTQYQILPAKKYINLYAQGQAPFLSTTGFNRLKQAYTDTTLHLNNPNINFVESN